MDLYRFIYVFALVTNFGGCGDPLMKDVEAVEPHMTKSDNPLMNNGAPRQRKSTSRPSTVRSTKKDTNGRSTREDRTGYGQAPFTGEFVKRLDYSDVIRDINQRLVQLEKAKHGGPLSAAYRFYHEYMGLVRNLDAAEAIPHRDIDPDCPPTELKIKVNQSSITIKRGKYIAHGSSSRIFKSPPVPEMEGRTLIVKSLGPLPDDDNKLNPRKVISRKIKLALLEDQAFMLAYASFDKLAPHVYELIEENMNQYCHARTIVSENVGATELGSIPSSLRRNPTVLSAIGASALDIIRRVHSTGLIHGDIHRRNFIVKDVSRPAKTLRIIDFGRVDLFMVPHESNYPEQTTLIPDNSNPKLTHDGWSPRLLSPWEIQGHRPTRRDDVFRIAEMLVFMFGDPQFNQEYNKAEKEYKQSRKSTSALIKFLNKVVDLKMRRSFDENLPQAVKDFYLYTTQLGFYDEPNYQEWINKLGGSQ